MAALRAESFENPQGFLDALSDYDNSFMNFALGSLRDSLDPLQATSQARWGPQSRTLVAIYKGDHIILTLTKIAKDFSWILSVIRDTQIKVSEEEYKEATTLLASFLPTVVDPKLVDKVIGPTERVNLFIETWVAYMETQRLSLKMPPPYFSSHLTYCTRETLPSPSPAFTHYRVSQAVPGTDVDGLTPLYFEFSQVGPEKPTMEQARSIMQDAVAANQIWLCRADGDIAGYVLVGRNTPRTAAIKNVFVPARYRRKGIAEALVRAVTRYYLGVEPRGFDGGPEEGPLGGPKEEICLNVVEEGVKRIYGRCGFLVGDEKDPRTGELGWINVCWRGIEQAGGA